jgi:hypothetical protein
MAPSRHADEGGQLQLMEPDRADEEEDCFESIDKRKPPPPPPLSSHLPPRITLLSFVVSCGRAREGFPRPLPPF